MILRYFHTLKFLKYKQVFYRVYYKLIKHKIKKNIKFEIRPQIYNYHIVNFRNPSLLDNCTMKFLNKEKKLTNIKWNGKKKNVSKLWRYNQHYFDDLIAVRNNERKKWHINLLLNWVKENPPCVGIGWDSYPTSLRIINWIKWQLSNNKLPQECIDSLLLQAQWLEKRIEWHILGNHLVSNAKALIFAGLFFSGQKSLIWLKKGIKIINQELNSQILKDGGHFERSPMYHSLILEDLLDLVNISKVYPKTISKKQINNWLVKIKKMFYWLSVMTHPNGEISFFNDSANKIALSFDQLCAYSKVLGIDYKSNKFSKVINLSKSGYIRLEDKNSVTILDTAKIGPDFLTAHSHADTLSFELSVLGKKVLVNSGTSEYTSGKIRTYERSTKAHNTVTINNKNSSDVWNSFRVANRAYPIKLSIKNNKKYSYVSCSHDGYSRYAKQVIHRRTWKLKKKMLIISDKINGPHDYAHAYYHFHPLIKVYKNSSSNWKIKMSNGKIINLKVHLGKAKLYSGYYSTEFGKRIKTNYLKVTLQPSAGSIIKINWANIQ